MLVPPVSAGGDQDRVMQSLKALTTFGADGGPGYAAGTHFYAVSLFLSISYNIEKWELIMII